MLCDVCSSQTVQRRLLPGQQGCIRFDGNGQVWLLNRPDKGWGEYGYSYPSWPHLMRRWALVVVRLDCDAHGPFAVVESPRVAGAALVG